MAPFKIQYQVDDLDHIADKSWYNHNFYKLPVPCMGYNHVLIKYDGSEEHRDVMLCDDELNVVLFANDDCLATRDRWHCWEDLWLSSEEISADKKYC